MDREYLRTSLLESGAVAVGFAPAGPVGEDEDRRLRAWLTRGDHAGMAWMERHAALRRDLNNVLPGTRTVISIAFPYAPRRERPSDLPYLSRYAYGTDYHEAIRSRLRDVLVRTGVDSVCRICIDSAPVSERFWAIRAGVGYRGDNGAIIVPGTGPEVFLAEILTTLEFEPDAPSADECLHCRACLRACPTDALSDDGTIDCRRCISYLTIEHRGPWTDPDAIAAMSTPEGRNSLLGCDRCITACPLRSDSSTNDTFPTLPDIMTLTPDDIPTDPAEFKRRFIHTALARPGAQNMLRNVENLDLRSK